MAAKMLECREDRPFSFRAAAARAAHAVVTSFEAGLSFMKPDFPGS
jgi:hypothetical protein